MLRTATRKRTTAPKLLQSGTHNVHIHSITETGDEVRIKFVGGKGFISAYFPLNTDVLTIFGNLLHLGGKVLPEPLFNVTGLIGLKYNIEVINSNVTTIQEWKQKSLT